MSNRPADIVLPEGWTWDRVERERAMWDIANTMIPVASAPGVVGWCTINAARMDRGDSPLDLLIHEYADWNAMYGLKLGSADEHLFDETLTEEQRAWLREFCRRWDVATEQEKAWADAEREAFGNLDLDGCTNPGGHEFACTGTAYGGDDESYHGEGRSYCIHCGADGDA